MRPKFRALSGEILLYALWALKKFCLTKTLRSIYSKMLAHLIARTNLFDDEHYLATYEDISQADILPLLHYAAYGDSEGRTPMPFFDPDFYRAHSSYSAQLVNTLLHYSWIGRYRNHSPSNWFNVEFYLAQNPDVAFTGIDPLHHYLQWGGLEGRSPCSHFDGTFYLLSNPDVAESKINPLYHYLTHGRFENRRCTQYGNGTDFSEIESGEIARATKPDDSIWQEFGPRANVSDATVDVIVPVYKGLAETLLCLSSVLSTKNDTLFELVVIDDASPDTELAEELLRLSRLGLFTLLCNQENYGFVRTVNRGMSLHPDRNVVLLNSDAEVYNYWLDRLQQAADRNQLTGTITPLSNNATICSYPRFLHDNPYQLELSYPELSELTANVNSGVEVEAPTAVGFCMYIKRDCLKEIGVFDEETFGKGYGEENDFCQRAIQKGWRNVIAADTFVRHWGSMSFQGEKAKRVEIAIQLINERYPDYDRDVHNFIEADPLGEARRRLDISRLKRMSRNENILIVCHNRGGGSERHVQEDIHQLQEGGMGIFLMRPQNMRSTHVSISHPHLSKLYNLKPFALSDVDGISSILSELNIKQIHIHSLADFASNAPEIFCEVASKLCAELEVNVHDYKAICPRINLINSKGLYCGEPDEKGCNQCLIQNGSDFNVTDISVWRTMRGKLLRNAKTVLVPDQDVADRLSRYFPDVICTVSPHEELPLESALLEHSTLSKNEKLRIVVIGAISKIKGYEILRSCALDAKKRKLPLEFILMGYSLDDTSLKKAGVTVTGRYLDQESQQTLQELLPHIVWLPSLWPETYSYTLSLALELKLPVFAFDIGAIASRLHVLNEVIGLMPLSIAEQPRKINDMFAQYRIKQIKGK